MTASAVPAAGMKSARCPRCGNSFDCGRNTEPFDCWCKSLPALPANELDPRGRCLCPECLVAAMAPAPGGAPKGGLSMP
ncbi:cysteine-rich CWC family protein [Paraburkholderia sp. JHI2823]|uniref:cysteine-rich CWC family protein n=1 Tax=Paraburkholderia TaxID=1822464 RepID=UPI000417F2BD|nr:cysteine-rich CWC family protein [Paraburkholderia mimosarum]